MCAGGRHLHPAHRADAVHLRARLHPRKTGGTTGPRRHGSMVRWRPA